MKVNYECSYNSIFVKLFFRMKRIFLSEFIKQKKTVGAITPSSKFLIKKMLSVLDFSNDISIVEIGPGTGVFTRELLARMTPNSKLMSFEINPNFYAQLQTKFTDSRLDLICDSAENLKQHLDFKPNAIVSSLPLAVIPIRVKLNILNAISDVLNNENYFIQFQYSTNAKKILEHKFSNVKVDFAPLNVPPAFIFYCKK